MWNSPYLVSGPAAASWQHLTSLQAHRNARGAIFTSSKLENPDAESVCDELVLGRMFMGPFPRTERCCGRAAQRSASRALIETRWGRIREPDTPPDRSHGEIVWLLSGIVMILDCELALAGVCDGFSDRTSLFSSRAAK